jgi:hypothetical protein
LNILNADEFRDIVKGFFEENGICSRKVRNNDRKDSRLNQTFFFDLLRTRAHAPDMMICEGDSWVPCELKAPKEFYKACRFSRAHLLSYFLQIVYGQCFSYADLFRCSDTQSIYLIIPKVITADIPGFNDIEPCFQDVLNTEWPIFHGLMGIEALAFSTPTFTQAIDGQNYGMISHNINLLATKISYQCPSNG